MNSLKDTSSSDKEPDKGDGQDEMDKNNSVEVDTTNNNNGDEDFIGVVEQLKNIIRMKGGKRVSKRELLNRCNELLCEMPILENHILKCEDNVANDPGYEEYKKASEEWGFPKLPEDGNFTNEWKMGFKRRLARISRAVNYRQAKNIERILDYYESKFNGEPPKSDQSKGDGVSIKRYEKYVLCLLYVRKNHLSVQQLGKLNRVLQYIYSECIGELVPQFFEFSDLFNILKRKCDETTKWTKGKIEELIKIVKDRVVGIYTLMGHSFSKALTAALDIVTAALDKWFVSDFIFESAKTAVNGLVFAVTCIMIFCVISLIQSTTSFTSHMFQNMLGAIKHILQENGMITTEEVNKAFIPQSDDTLDAVLMICTFVGGIMSIPAIGVKRLVEVCRVVTGLRGASSSVTDLARGILHILPVCVQTALVEKFGTELEKLVVKAEHWLSIARAVVGLRETGRVVSSQEYYDIVRKLTDEGKIIVGKLPNAHALKTYVGSMMAKLGSIEMTLTTNKHRNRARAAPFSVHFAGRPGIGKTTSIRAFMKRIANINDSDIFVRQPGTDHWDGFISARAIVYDEFMVSTNPTITDPILNEYLSLVSSETFFPPLPSVDRLAQGLKGTPADPDMVATINNTIHCPVTSLRDKDAFLRRRNVIIEFVDAPNAMYKASRQTFNKNKRIDIDYYVKKKQYEQRPWLRCNLYDCNGIPIEERQGLTYEEMITYVQEMYDCHTEIGRAMLSSDQDMDTMRSPNEILKDTIVDVYKSEESAKSLTEVAKYMADIVKERFFPQGRRKKAKKTEEDLPIIQYHEMKQEEIKTPLDDNVTQVEADGGVPIEDNSECQSVMSFVSATETQQEEEIVQYYMEREAVYEPGLYNMITDYPSWSSRWFTNVVKGIGIVMSLFSLIHWFRAFTNGESEPEPQGHSKQKKQDVRKSKKQGKLNARRFGKSKFRPQGGGVSEVRGSIDGHPFKAIGWKQRKILLPLHYLLDQNGDLIDDGVDMTIVVGQTKVNQKFNHMNLVCLDDGPCVENRYTYDFAVYDVADKHLPQFRDVTKQFLDEADLQTDVQFRVQVRSSNGLLGGLVVKAYNKSYVRGRTRFEMPRSFVGTYTTASGDCGSPVQIIGGEHAGKLLGFHVAGSRNGYAMTMCITKQMIENIESEDEVVIDDDIEFQTQMTGEDDSEDEIVVDDAIEFQTQNAQIEEITGTNIEWIVSIPKHQMVSMPKTTKIRDSPLLEYLPWEKDKYPAVLSKDDPRSDGSDPVVNAIKRSADAPIVDIDENLLEMVADDVYEKYDRELSGEFEFRELTFEEAIGGIPGVFNAIDTSTNIGWPLSKNVKTKGKRDYLWYDEEKQKVVSSPIFKELVMEAYEQLKNGQYDPDQRFLMFLKDENRTLEKVKTANTRNINSGNAIINVAARMLFGSVMVALGKSGLITEASIGINQFSKDMEKVREYLDVFEGGCDYIIGDFKNFDQNQPFQFTLKAYELLGRMLKDRQPGFSMKAWKAFTKQQTTTPVQVYDKLIKYKKYHASGALLTTQINCLVVSMLIRYAFAKKHKATNFEEVCRTKCLGDDHVCAVKKGFDFTGRDIKKELKDIGQIYTSALKEDDPGPNVDFDGVVFLGANPRMVEGYWVGCASKKILQSMVSCTRGEETIAMVVEQALDLASLWDETYYDYYYHSVATAMEKAGFLKPAKRYRSRQYNQMHRDTGSGSQHNSFYAQSGGWETALGGTATSMSGIHTLDLKMTTPVCTVGPAFATVQRAEPERYSIDIERRYPIGTLVPDVGLCYERSSCQGKMVIDGSKIHLNVRIPHEIQENTYLVDMQTHGDRLCLNMIPIELDTEQDYGTFEPQGLPIEPDTEQDYGTFEPQGLFDLLTVNYVKSDVQVRDVTGDVPIESCPDGRNVRDDNSKVDATFDIVPFDNPPLASGSAPVMQTYSSMSKSVGIEPTNSLQLHPGAMSRQQNYIFDNEELDIEYLCGQKCLVRTMEWSDTMEPGEALWDIELNSILGRPTSYKDPYSPLQPDIQFGFPLNLTVLNLAMLWHADLEFEINVVRTQFHSGRLQFSVGYGARQKIASTDRSVYYNVVMDFSGKDSRVTVTVPYNASTEFLRTFEGDEAPDSSQNYSLGYAGIFVMNQLRRTDTVTAAVDVLVFLRLKNVKIAVPRPLPFVRFQSTAGLERGYSVGQYYNANAARELMDVHGFQEVAAGTPTLASIKEEPEKPLTKRAIENENFEPQMNHVVDGMTSLVNEPAVSHIRERPSTVSNLAVSEQKMNLLYGTDSMVFRESFEWNVGAIRGALLKEYKVPWDLLVVGNSDNLQNMPFERYSFVVTDVEILVQVNATPFQKGRLVVFFLPMTTTSDIDVVNYTATDHIILDPQENTTGVLRVPFRFPRSVLNTSARDTESLGVIGIRILSQLDSIETKPATVSVFSRFPDAKFTIPKPINPAPPPPTAEEIIDTVFEPQSLPETMLQAEDTTEAPIHTNIESKGDQESTELNVAVTEVRQEKSSQKGQLQLGHKFEFTPKNVLDFVRRHSFIGVIPQTNVLKSEVRGSPFGNTVMYSLHVAPNNLMANFYAGWAGTIKYRIFLYDSTTTSSIASLTNVMFLPFIPKSGYEEIDIHLMHPYCGQQSPFGATATYMASETFGGTNYTGIPKAQELDYKVNTKMGFIDVSVPFETHMNYLDTHPGQGIPELKSYLSVGTLIFTFDHASGVKSNQTRIAVAEAAGDDFRYGLYRPPRRIVYLPLEAKSNATGSTPMRAGGYYLTAVP